jgi:hypothetical protein
MVLDPDKKIWLQNSQSFWGCMRLFFIFFDDMLLMSQDAEVDRDEEDGHNVVGTASGLCDAYLYLAVVFVIIYLVRPKFLP